MIASFQRSQLPELQQWWDTGVPFVEMPTDSWCEYVCDTDNVHCLCSVHNGRIEAYCHIDIEDGTGHIAVVTNPLSRRQGHATKILLEAEQRLADLDVRKLVAAIEADNFPSIALFERNGYIRIEGTAPGFVDYQKDIQRLALYVAFRAESEGER